jgi:hypothetical protein
MNCHTVVIEFDGEEREVDVSYDFYPATRGQRGSCGEPLEPDEPAHVEVHSYKMDGNDIEGELTVGQLQRIEEQCLRNEGV